MAAAPASAAPASLLDASTQAVIAGVLTWKDKTLVRFPTHHRKDRELHALLGKRGVPAKSRTLLLDRQATRSAILKALDKAVAATGPGATLLVYFAGHGLRQPDGSVVLATWDLDHKRPSATGLPVSLLSGHIGSRFRGARVLLMADACYSGGLAVAARALRKRGVAAIALTSAAVSNASTGSWSFTQTVIDGLSGRRDQDRDGDGRIRLNELAAEVAEVMKYREGQRHGFDASPAARLLTVATTRGQPARKRGSSGMVAAPTRQWVTVPVSGGRLPARVLGRKTSTVQVEAYNYSDYVRVEVPLDQARPLILKTWPPGTRLDVTWNGQIYEAKVLKVADGFHYITYPGWPSVWNEWLTASRIVGVHRDPAGGARACLVQWKGRWWPARVLRKKGRKICIRYVGYSADWDECVPPTRLRCEPVAAAQVMVRWQNRWYPAVVLKRQGDKSLVHYMGYDATWDEWVGPKRLRKAR